MTCFRSDQITCCGVSSVRTKKSAITVFKTTTTSLSIANTSRYNGSSTQEETHASPRHNSKCQSPRYQQDRWRSHSQINGYPHGRQRCWSFSNTTRERRTQRHGTTHSQSPTRTTSEQVTRLHHYGRTTWSITFHALFTIRWWEHESEDCCCAERTYAKFQGGEVFVV